MDFIIADDTNLPIICNWHDRPEKYDKYNLEIDMIDEILIE